MTMVCTEELQNIQNQNSIALQSQLIIKGIPLLSFWIIWLSLQLLHFTKGPISLKFYILLAMKDVPDGKFATMSETPNMETCK